MTKGLTFVSWVPAGEEGAQGRKCLEKYFLLPGDGLPQTYWLKATPFIVLFSVGEKLGSPDWVLYSGSHLAEIEVPPSWWGVCWGPLSVTEAACVPAPPHLRVSNRRSPLYQSPIMIPVFPGKAQFLFNGFLD